MEVNSSSLLNFAFSTYPGYALSMDAFAALEKSDHVMLLFGFSSNLQKVLSKDKKNRAH